MSSRLLLAVAIFAALLTACSDPLEDKFGEDLYRAGCAHCHGVDLSGGTGPAIGPGSNADTVLSDLQISGVIKVGPGSMPGFEKRLTDAQIDSVIRHMRIVQAGSAGEQPSGE